VIVTRRSLTLRTCWICARIVYCKIRRINHMLTDKGSLHLRIPDVSETASLGRSAGHWCRWLRVPQFYLTLCEPLSNLPASKPSRGMSSLGPACPVERRRVLIVS
jgi:hypothetical protein